MITGIVLIRGSARIAFRTSMPEIPGIMTSSNTRSMRLLASVASAEAPLSAMATS